MAINWFPGGVMRAYLLILVFSLLCLHFRLGQLQIPVIFQFTGSVYNATIYENAAALSYVESEIKMGIVSPQTESWDVKYSIESGDDEGVFETEEFVLGDFCFLRIRTKAGGSAILNREVQDTYVLNIKAKASNNLEASARVDVEILDMNDLRPLFSPTMYTITVPESTPVGVSVGQVTATDADIGSNGKFYYFFREFVEQFAVHPTSGMIYLTSKANADENKKFELEVLAVDRGIKVYENNGVSSTAKVVINIIRVNEYSPSLNAAALSNKDPVYALVTVEDPDEGLNGEIEWVSIIEGDPLEQFVLDRAPLGNAYMLKLSEPADWNTFAYSYNLTLQAKDRGTPPKFSNTQVLQVFVKKPQVVRGKFEKEVYSATINEMAPSGTIVQTVKIAPKQQSVSYRLHLTLDSSYFNINTFTGVISTARPLRGLGQQAFDLEVTEDVSGLRSRVQMTVEDANDNVPAFIQSSYTGSVDENTPVGTVILVLLAVDDDRGDNGRVTYSISSLEALPFTLEQNSGELKTSEELDFESSSETYVFAVRASDWGLPYRRESEVNVTIQIRNINDNPPLFERVSCAGTIAHDFTAGQTIITVSAIDMDELGLLKYTILSGNEQDVFNLNPDSGMLSLRRSVSIRNEQFSLKVVAFDGEFFSEPTFVNISVVKSNAAKSFNCRDTNVAQKLAENLLKKASAGGKINTEEGYSDLFSVNRYAPQFESFPSDVAVRENLSVGSTVIKVSTTDKDTGFNSLILHVISNGNTDNCFNIDMESGDVYVYQPLDRERSDRYLLNITIYDMGLVQKSSCRLLTVNVIDVNDNSPRFAQESYTTVVSENTDAGTEVIQVMASDIDFGQNSEIFYTLLTNTPLFSINTTTGWVYVSGQLDREIMSEFTLKIEARDQADRGSQRFSVTTLKVYLEDLNDCPPVFMPNSYSCLVLEDIPVGTVIIWLQAHDPDLAAGGRVKYSLANDFNGTFNVNMESGAVKVAKELNYEKNKFYNLSVVAQDCGFPSQLSSYSYAEVEVVDVSENLNKPSFSEFAARASVKENSRLGTSVVQVTAKDDDKGRDGIIRYSIKAGSGLGRFFIDEETGVIYTNSILDCETQDSYWLTVYATDQGPTPLSASTEVFVQVEDVNDNAPLTSEPIYHGYVMENSPKGVSVMRVQASDPDVTSSANKLTYRITAGNPQNFFAIDSKTGLITTTSRKLDREKQAEHFLEVTVTDGGGVTRQSTVWVIVHIQDENDNKPEFPEKLYCISLPERDRNKRGDPVYRVFAYDRDDGPNAELTYSIEGGNEDGKFFINAKTGMVFSRKMVTAGGYDVLTIKTIDNGIPQKWSTTRLHVEWIRKPLSLPQALRFSARIYNFTVAENTKVPGDVGVISVQPTQSQLWFNIIGGRTSQETFYIPHTSRARNCTAKTGNNDEPLDVQKGMGTILLAKPLDAETQSFYNLTVQVTDGTNTATTQVHVRVLDSNDNTPVFSQPVYEVSVSEDVPVDTEVLRTRATDADEQAKLTYSIHGSVDPVTMRTFRINPGTGIVYTAEVLDYEARTRHILIIMVKDQEFPYYRDLARIIVNVQDSNDQSPFFTHAVYDGKVIDSALPGTPVVQVTALDRDAGRNKELVYSIESGNTGGAFGIDPLSGMISLARELDVTGVAQYVLTVRATDGGTPARSATASARITVSLSDVSSPKFTQQEYQAEIDENVPVGAFVTHVRAKSYSELIYDITQGNKEKTFKINRYTGVITTRRSLDFEATTSYTLVIRAVNMAGIGSSATVNVQVVDVNDNPPVLKRMLYSGSVSESAPVNSVVSAEDGSPLVIQATDPDKNQNSFLVFQIVDDLARSFFTVDSGTGSVRTVANLDYETFSEFYFQVNVRDNCSPELTVESPAEVIIKVVNINDSPPKFSQDAYDAVLLLPTYAGVEVLRVNASDPDMNSDLIFSISENNLDVFAIDSKSGVLTVKSGKLSQDRYCFSITASDGRYSCTALVTVLVREALDSGLVFGRPSYFCSVSENISDTSTLVVVTAIGNRLNEPLKYALLNPGSRFSIHPTSGAVLTTGVPFDREEQEYFELVVEASREYDRIRVARVTVQVQVKDVNDNAPEFVGRPYYAAVQVDAQLGLSIFQVSATDPDKGDNGRVSYELKEEHRYFGIHGVTGELTLKRTFIEDLTNAEFPLVIIACDAGDPSFFTEVELPVRVVSKAMPVFDRRFYGISVREDIAVSTQILNVNATSPQGQNIVYTIADADASLPFDIDFDTGVISVVYPLDFETTPYYRLTVRSTDTFTGAGSEVDVEIIVVDVNDNAPVFEKAFYSATLAENSLTGTSVVQLSATDKDSENNAAIRYQILSDVFNSTDYFHLDGMSGLVLTARLLDYELVRRHSFTVRATDSGSPLKSTEVTVTVSVIDTNDNPPSFNQPLYEAFISKLAPRGHFVTCVQASDADGCDVDRLRYSILSGDERMAFVMDFQTGVISLSNQRRLGDQTMYVLNVSVSDGVFTSTAQVNVQVLGANLYSPVFSQRFYLAEVKENTPAGTTVIQVSATDEDSGLYGQIMYSFINDLGKSLFIIRADGEISTAQKLDKENPLHGDIVLMVMALDGGGKASYCTVRVMLTDENDNAPRFRAVEYKVSIKANIAPGSLVTQIQAQDPDSGDNGKVFYSLYSEARLPLVDVLEIEPDTGWIVTKGSMAHLRGTVLSFFVKATDSGAPAKHSLVSAFIHVLPPDASVPTFSQPQYSFTIPEDTPVGTALGSVYLGTFQKATFALVNGETMESNQGRTFVMDKDSGLLRLDDALDYELVSIYRFKVAATIRENLVESMSVVEVEVKILDMNDNKPSFETSSYVAMVMEGMPVGTRVIQVCALDPDWGSNGQVTYRLGAILNNEKDQTSERNISTGAMFAIDSKTGWITTLGDLDHERCPSYTFSVIASDLGETVALSSTAVVTVAVADVNDNPPTFEKDHYRGAVRENDPVGEVVSVLSTRDLDTSDQNRLVSIYITGVISLSNQRRLGEQMMYVLNVSVSDSVFTSTAQVNVQVLGANLYSPVFSQRFYLAEVKENTPAGTVVIQVSATDEDSGLYGGNPRGVFALAPVKGEWKVFVKQPLDREEQDRYLLSITASDGLFATRAIVEVTVMDVNDNSPICTQASYEASFPEDIPVDGGILTVGATDADTGSNAKIQYSVFGVGAEDFSVDVNTGEIKTASLMDRERTPAYKLTSQATDRGGLFCRSEIFLSVTDVNDNAPSFFFTEFLASVFENAAPKSLITRVQASDPDEGMNRKILYSLASSADGIFSIDPSLGVVMLEKPLDRELQDSYRVRVQAADLAGEAGSLSTQVDLTVMVLDVNDNPPVFQKHDYAVTVPEDVAVGTELLRVFASSKDIGVNAQIYYSISTGNELGRFSIDEATGVIVVADDLDYEVCKDFYLRVEAMDGGSPALKTSTIVSIEIMDVNDNAPSFSEDVYNVLVSEDATIGETVTRLLAEDLDSILNGCITYSILRGDPGNQFWIDPITGLLKVNKALNREKIPSYRLSVQAFDSGSPAMSTTVTVNIEIADVNDNAPAFSPANASAVIQLNKPVGTSILTLSVSDKDSPRNGGPFVFRILSGNENDVFSLDRNGELRSNKVFKPGATREYTLEIQAQDSGQPRLSSSSFVFVRVIGGSIFKPVAFPLEISVVMAEDVFPGGIIGKIYASDRDENDVLTFTQLPQPKSLFKINRQDGKIVAFSGLKPGRYFMNATVSDGQFSETVGVTVLVELATEEMVQNAVTLLFQDVSPEDFVGTYLKHVKKTLHGMLGGTEMAQTPGPLHIVGVQPGDRSSLLEVLLAVEAQSGGYLEPGELALRLGGLRETLRGSLRLVDVLDQSCSGELDCGEKACRVGLKLEPGGQVVYSTSRVSLVLPRFSRTESCACSGGICSSNLELCEGQSCPPDMQCVRTGPTAPSACQCLPDMLDQCTGQTSMSFAGSSYIKYRVTDSCEGQDMKMSLKIRTLQSRGVVIYSRAEPCIMLKLDEGRLWFQLDCSTSLDVLSISGRPVSDGLWHALALELTQNYTLISLDDSYVERWRTAQAPVHLWPLGTDCSLFFGAQVTQSSRHWPGQAVDGFQGCLADIVLNGNELPLESKRSRYSEVTAVSEVNPGCVVYPDPCLGVTCQNGGTCAILPAGAFACSCPPQYTGAQCETRVTSCMPTPCQNGGDCKAVGSTFLCGCPRGFTGLICDKDVNECEREECENGGACVNTFGAFYCNCTAGFEGQFCGQPSAVLVGTQAEDLSYIGPAEVIGIGVLSFVVLVLLLLLAAFRKKILRKDWTRAEAPGITTETNYALRKTGTGAEGIEFRAVPIFNGETNVGPPQVMVRPTAYTRPRCQGEKAEGLATLSCPPLLGSFQMEVPHFLGVPRRDVAVCSVAPNLPSLLPNCPLRKPPWEKDDTDGGDDDDDDDDDEEFKALNWRDGGYQAEGEEVNTTREPSGAVEEAACLSDGSTSDVHSARSESCDDSGSIVTVIQLVSDTVDSIENEAHQWRTSPYTNNVLMPGLESIPPCQSTQWPPTPPPSTPAPSPPIHLSPARLGGSVRLSRSTHSLQTGYPLRRYDNHRELSPCRDGCVLRTCNERSPYYSSYHEGGVSPSCYHYSHGSDRLPVWKNSPSFGSQKQIGKLGDRPALGERHSHGNQHSPLKGVTAVDQYELY